MTAIKNLQEEIHDTIHQIRMLKADWKNLKSKTAMQLNSIDLTIAETKLGTLEKCKSMIINLREELADLEHEQWSHWIEYQNKHDIDAISEWQRKAETPYSKLTEKEKESDRVWADKVIEKLLGEIK